MIALAFETKSHKEKVLDFLDEFNWKPESIEDKDGQYNITLIAKLDIKQIKKNIYFIINYICFTFESNVLVKIVAM